MTAQIHAQMVGTVTADTVFALLQDAGYRVTPPRFSKSRQLLINGTLRVVVKGALWTKAKHSKGRYQFNTRQDADLYILGCMTHAPRFFIVPGRIIGNRENVAIWSEFPSKYVGRWTEYCDAWHILDEELTRCKNSAIA